MRRLALAVVGCALALAGAPSVNAAPGDLDPTFGGTGVVRTRFGPTVATAERVFVQPDGGILLLATVYPAGSPGRVGLARFLPDGSLDPSFGGNGKTVVSGGSALDAALSPDGSVVASYWFVHDRSLQNRFGVLRVDPGGERDGSFGGDGRVTVPFGDRDAIAWSVAVASSGKPVAAGQVADPDGNTVAIAVARYLEDGSLDAGFGSGGVVSLDLSAGWDAATDVAVQDDGKIVAAGSAGDRGMLVRLRRDGTLDPTFDGDGVLLSDAVERFDDVAVLDDGAILAAGGTSVARFLPDGSLDAAFGAGGLASTTGPDVAALAVDGAGRIVAAGSVVTGASSVAAVVRFLPGGSLDATFGDGGVAVADVAASSHYARGVDAQADGRVVVAVWRSRYPKTARAVAARLQG